VAEIVQWPVVVNISADRISRRRIA